MSAATKQNVLVVGGGGAGVRAFKQLSKQLDHSTHELILITPRAYDISWPAMVRAVVTEEGRLESTDVGACAPYDKLYSPGKGSVKIDTVIAVEGAGQASGGTVRLASGETLPFAALILCPGSLWEGPLDLPVDKAAFDAHFASWRAKFKNAKHVVLAGGGAVGIEIAGELKDYYPEKKVTIVQGSESLLNPSYPASFRHRLDRDMKARGIEVIFGDYIDSFPEGSTAPDGYKTRNGKHLDADLIVPTRGGRPATAFLANSGLSLNTRGQVAVEGTLQAKGAPRVFVIGDATDLPEQKQVAKLDAHAAVAVPNVLAVLAGTPPPKTYNGATELIVVTNGKKGGAAYFNVLWGIQLGNWFASMVKSKDLFVGKYRGDMGY